MIICIHYQVVSAEGVDSIDAESNWTLSKLEHDQYCFQFNDRLFLSLDVRRFETKSNITLHCCTIRFEPSDDELPSYQTDPTST